VKFSAPQGKHWDGINLLKSAGYVMHQMFNIQQL